MHALAYVSMPYHVLINTKMQKNKMCNVCYLGWVFKNHISRFAIKNIVISIYDLRPYISEINVSNYNF